MSTHQGRKSSKNSTTTPIPSGQTLWQGEWEDVSNYASIVVRSVSDRAGTLKVMFSEDKDFIESTLEFNRNIENGNLYTIRSPHRLAVTGTYLKVMYEQTDAGDMTRLSVTTLIGFQSLLTTPRGLPITPDADALFVRSLNDIEIVSGLIEGWSKIFKTGRNTDIDSATVPEDIIDGGGVYAGFPDISSPEEFQIVLGNSNDIGGSLTFIYLASDTSTEYQTATVVTTGLTTNTGITGVRSHTMYWRDLNTNNFNEGLITLRHRVTTANIFLTIVAGRSQSNYAVYTVPYDAEGIVTRIHGEIRAGVNVSIDGSFWIRANGLSPRYRKPWDVTPGSFLNENTVLRMGELTDIKMTALAVNGNNVEMVGGMDILTIKQYS